MTGATCNVGGGVIALYAAGSSFQRRVPSIAAGAALETGQGPHERRRYVGRRRAAMARSGGRVHGPRCARQPGIRPAPGPTRAADDRGKEHPRCCGHTAPEHRVRWKSPAKSLPAPHRLSARQPTDRATRRTIVPSCRIGSRVSDLAEGQRLWAPGVKSTVDGRRKHRVAAAELARTGAGPVSIRPGRCYRARWKRPPSRRSGLQLVRMEVPPGEILAESGE